MDIVVSVLYIAETDTQEVNHPNRTASEQSWHLTELSLLCAPNGVKWCDLLLPPQQRPPAPRGQSWGLEKQSEC